MPKVSVIMAVNNEEKYIKKAALSILNQTHHNLELIVIDDHSTDKSIDIISKINDERIKIYKNARAKGVANAKNLGIEKSTGDYVAIQDADDQSRNDRIEKQLSLIEQENDVIGSWLEIRKENGVTVKNLPTSSSEIEKGFESFYNRLTFVAGTMLAPREVVLKFPLRSKFKYMSDWDQLLRLWESGNVNFKNVPEPLYYYYLRQDNSISFDHERVRYNVFLRHCESQRKRNLKEYKNINEFDTFMKSYSLRSIYWRIFFLIKKLQHKFQF